MDGDTGGHVPQSTTLKNFQRISTENVQKRRNFHAIFTNFGTVFSFFACSFLEVVIIVPEMLERSPINFNSTRTFDSGKQALGS